jgi:hypothetical protein
MVELLSGALRHPERMWNVGIDREKESADPRAL